MRIGDTVNREPTGIETLDLQLAHTHDGNRVEYVRIANIDDTVSMMIIQFAYNLSIRDAQAVLTADEIDMVIEGLVEAKRRLKT